MNWHLTVINSNTFAEPNFGCTRLLFGCTRRDSPHPFYLARSRDLGMTRDSVTSAPPAHPPASNSGHRFTTLNCGNLKWIKTFQVCTCLQPCMLAYLCLKTPGHKYVRMTANEFNGILPNSIATVGTDQASNLDKSNEWANKAS